MTAIILIVSAIILVVVSVGIRTECRAIRARYQGRRDLLAGSVNPARLTEPNYLSGVVTEHLNELDTTRVADCPVCGTIAVTHHNNKCTICAYWTERVTEPDALIISGNLYHIGLEPTPEDLADNPKRYGSYGTGFRIRRHDGTETLTHNLWHSGTIPAALRPADNAEFTEVTSTPTPRPVEHNCFNHLDYIGGHYPYECVVRHCYRRYDHDDITAYCIANAIKSLNSGCYCPDCDTVEKGH